MLSENKSDINFEPIYKGLKLEAVSELEDIITADILPTEYVKTSRIKTNHHI